MNAGDYAELLFCYCEIAASSREIESLTGAMVSKILRRSAGVMLLSSAASSVVHSSSPLERESCAMV